MVIDRVARALSDAFEFTKDEADDLARVATPVAVQYVIDTIRDAMEAGNNMQCEHPEYVTCSTCAPATSATNDFEAWLAYGQQQGYVSDPYCGTHDRGEGYMTPEMVDEFEAGNDPCVDVLQVLVGR